MNNKNSFKFSVLALISCLSLGGCSTLFDWIAKKNYGAATGVVVLAGLTAPVSINRDEFGVPFVEASNVGDLSFGIGYAMAEDRLAQMVSMNLLARGRLSEMAGALTVDMDKYMRIIGVPQVIAARYALVSPELKSHLESFSAGVNAYIDTHQDRLPLEFVLNGYTPEPWQAENTLGLFVLLNLGVGFNIHEELAYLQMAAVLGAEKAAYLAPIYPDEPIDFAEAAKLSGLSLAHESLTATVSSIAKIEQQLKQINGQGLAASNNWAVHKNRTAAGASLVANDTHLLLSHPSTWILMGAKSPEYSGIGIGLPGIPALVAGYNGHIAWGETMVMADSQDIFLEQLRDHNGVTEYRFKEAWLPVEQRTETIQVKGGKPITFTVQSTRHGPLLNSVLAQAPKNDLIPMQTESRYGLALSWTAQFPDNTVDAFFQLGQAKNLDDVEAALNDVRFIHLNVVAGDKDNIAWQITGTYPLRNGGTGHFPSPGWTGEYDWIGSWGGADTPRVRNPQQGYLATANDRTVEPGFQPTLTSSWFYPERGERARQLLEQRSNHDAANMVAMQADRVDILLKKVQSLWLSSVWQRLLQEGLNSLAVEKKSDAQMILNALLNFDGNMLPESKDAAIWGAFEHILIQEIFSDELGATDSPLWTAFMAMNARAYSGYQDHLLGRKTPSGDWAPFWDDTRTEEAEHPGHIIARSLAKTRQYLITELGKDESAWQWGQLANYYWKTETTHMLPYLAGIEKFAVKRLAKYTDRGPFPAGGNRNTLNVAGFNQGQNYDVWNVPAMRMVVDFSQPEPLQLVVAGGQSGNPASPHYDDGIHLWLSTKNRTLPFNSDERVQQHFANIKRLIPHSEP